jgi:ribosomal-protein-alanine N-acetyltransferase
MTDDVDRLMAVMATAFDPTYGEAWTRRQIEDALMIGNCHALLVGPSGGPIQPDEDAAGFSLSRTGYEEEELLLFAVRPEYRRRGIGHAILKSFASAAKARGARRLLLEMRRGNPADSLYRAFGFSVIGERKDYYKTQLGTRVDAITFAFEMDQPV